MISVQRKKQRLREGRVVASDLPGASKEGCWRWEEGICASPTPLQQQGRFGVGCLGSLLAQKCPRFPPPKLKT